MGSWVGGGWSLTCALSQGGNVGFCEKILGVFGNGGDVSACWLAGGWDKRAADEHR